MTDLHVVPLVRREPGQEQAELTRVLGDWAQGKVSGARLIHAVRSLRNQRHESAEGKFEIDRAVGRALQALDGMLRADGRKALYPPDPVPGQPPLRPGFRDVHHGDRGDPRGVTKRRGAGGHPQDRVT